MTYKYEYLTKKENWTPERKHIHRTALVAGTILGFLIGINTVGFIWALLNFLNP